MTQDRILKEGDDSKLVVDTEHQDLNVGDNTQHQNALDNVRVVHGSNDYYASLSGMSVGDVRKKMKDTLNLPGDVPALVGGQEVADDFVLVAGMNLEFSKDAGRKGGIRKPPFRIADLEDEQPDVYEMVTEVIMQYAIEMYQEQPDLRNNGLESLFETLIEMVDAGQMRVNYNGNGDYFELLKYSEVEDNYVSL